MLILLLRFIRGFVCFEISGKYPERFINITARNSVRLWDVKRGSQSFTACMYMSDYIRIRPLARRAGVRLRIKSKKGAPSFISRYRGRVGVAVGACAFVITVFVMSMFIWSIDISGLDTLSVSDMQALLRDEGLYVGAFKPSLDYQGIARDIMLSRHEVGWMAVNVTGSYASVEVKEESPAPEVTDIDSPCNVKARCDGRILSIDTEQGTATLPEGSGVIEGQVLVSGVMTDALGGVRLVHADARVMAQTTHEAQFVIDSDTGFFRPDGDMAVRRRVGILGLSLPYSFESVDSPYSFTDSYSESPSPLGVRLPLRVDTELVHSLEQVSRELDYNSAMELLKTLSRLYESFALADCRVTNRGYRLREADGEYTLSVTYTCVEDIAVSSPIGTDENTQLLSEDPLKYKEE